MYDDDTIAAISTPVGEGGIGIVRLSGPQALTITQELFVGSRTRTLAQVPAYSLHHGSIVHPETRAVVDEVLVTVMRAPHSYTREDVVEINCHGGTLPLRNVLELVLARGARLAMPGEFTKRAFLNGRLDLSQAEAVLDIIRAKTDAGLQLAIQQLRGKLSRHVHEIHQSLKHLLALLEAAIDFPEDEIEIIAPERITTALMHNLAQLDGLLASAREGKIVREGLSVVIAGKPNVGKSSLLNLLLEEERAIVTPIPGTTRDTIEEYLNLQGIPLRLIDTAGLRDSADHVEILGVTRSRNMIRQADLILCMFDASQPWSSEDEAILQSVQAKETFILLNKIDLPAVLSLDEVRQQLPTALAALPLSLTEHTGVDRLKQTLIDHVMRIPLDSVEVANVRHQRALSQAKESLNRARQTAEAAFSYEFIALDVREALKHIGEITGETTTDDILDAIFSTFCIGK